MQKKVKILIVDDSKVFRETLKSALDNNPNIQVVGTAEDAFEANDMIEELSPQVLLLDMEMPKMDGKTFLKRLMVQCPMPCIMVTSSDLTEQEALDAGAAGFMKKPRSPHEMHTFCSIIAAKIIIAASSKITNAAKNNEKIDGIFTPTVANLSKVTPELPSTEEIRLASEKNKDYIIALGASTGGTDALECVIKSFSDSMPPILVVQHMPPVFTKMYAERLDRSCSVHVKEAEDGDRLGPGECLIGAGGYHLELKKDSKGYYVRSTQGEKVSGHCPSVDVLFSSVAETAGKNAIAALMTGMGADGAKGLLKMHSCGAYTIGQDKDSCVVYGMPMEAYKLGACSEQQPLSKIGVTICRKLASGWKNK